MRSVNQNHHLYVATGVGTVSEGSSEGTIQAVVGGDNVTDRHLYFLYKGRDGVTRSDLIPINQITYMKYVPASQQVTKLKKVEVTLSSDINSGNTAVVGQDYVLNIHFQQFYGLSPENDYVKTVAVHVTSANSAKSDFYKAMVKELNAAFSREVGASAKSNPYLKFMIKTGSDPLEETSSSFDDAGTSATGIIIEEKEQPWSLGKWEVESLMFNVFPSTIYNSGEEVVWGNANVVTSTTTVPNSKKMADLEWFTFKERADYYGEMGYPNNFTFRSIVDPANSNGYDALEIHFAYQGSCEDIQKSEKDITIIASAASSGTIIKSLANSIESIASVNGGQSLTQVETPVATPGSGSGLSGTVKVTLSCATPGAKIYYSTSDSTPDEESTEYDGGEISLTSDTHIYAIAIKDGMTDSEIIDSFYDFT